MAFNPFQKFRKHQKGMFAVLTICCMFVFVLSSGYGGDAMQYLIKTLTGAGGGGPRSAAAKLYGEDISERQLAELASQRALAQTYLSEAIQRAMQNRAGEVRKKMKEGHTGMNLPPQQEEMFLRQRLQMDEEMGRLQGEAITIMIRGGRSGDYRSLLDFLIWQHEAKRLGIYLTKNDINSLVGRLTSNRLTPRDSGLIEKALRADQRFKGMSSDQLIKAVGDEFQVQLAQLALTGGEQQFGAKTNTLAEPPAVPTPQQFWTFYRDQCSGIDVALLPFKVEDFLAQVTDKPSEKDLKDLYEKYKDKEYDPQSGDPAFKRSRRIQVEWVSGKADSPFYRKAGLESFKTSQDVAKVAALLGDAASGQPLLLGTDAIMPRTLEMTLRAEYDSSRSFSYRNDKTWLERWGYIHDKFHPTYLYRPDSVTAAVGAAALGSVPLSVTGASAAAALIGPAEQRENDVRLRYQGTFLLSGAALSPLTTTAMAAAALTADEYVPYEFAKPEIEERVQNRLARRALLGNLKTVQQEIEKLAKDKGKEAEIQKYLAEAVKKYDLQTGKTTSLRGGHKDKLIDDPGMKGFKEAYLKPPSFDSTGKDFDKQFFSDKKPFEGDLWPSQLEGGTAEQQFLFWKTEDQKADRVPFDQVRADVEKAWRYQKARDLAKKAAEKVAEEAKKTGGDVKKLADLAAQQKTKVIEVGPIAQMHRKRSAAATVEFSYEGPHIDKSKVPNLDGDADREGSGPTQASTYGQGFASKLLPLRDKDKGSTVVVPDQTEGAYYLAVLVKQTEPSLQDFYEAYQNSAAPPSDGSPAPKKSDPMFQNYVRQEQSQYREKLLERLRKDAKLEILKEKIGRLGSQDDES